MSQTDPINMDDFTQEELDNLPEHELAHLIPEMASDEYQKLIKDIEAHGLMEPIVLFDGQVLDGRHRHRAFSEHRAEWGKEWTSEHFVVFAGTAEDARLRVTENVQRRHLTKPGLAVVACTLYLDDAKEEAAQRQAASGDDNFDKTGESYDLAASKVSGVSGRSVREIDKIRQDDELQDVWKDLLKGRFRFISEAKKLASLDKDDRQKARAYWEEQQAEQKDWKTAIKAVDVDGAPKEPKKSDTQKTYSRLRTGLRRFCDSFDALDELPTMQDKSEQKKTEYKNFLTSVLEDLEEKIA